MTHHAQHVLTHVSVTPPLHGQEHMYALQRPRSNVHVALRCSRCDRDLLRSNTSQCVLTSRVMRECQPVQTRARGNSLFLRVAQRAA
eukprot:1357463-Alexandrium_andersonii.AAC.1